MAKLSRVYGLDIHHESMGLDGISSWMFAADAESVPFSHDDSAPKDYIFDYMIQVIRNPLKAIASVATVEYSGPSLVFRRKYVNIRKGVSTIIQATQSFLGWNKLIKARGPDAVIKVEEADKLLPAFYQTRALISSVFRPVALPPKDTNARKHKSIRWDEIKSVLYPDLREELIDFCKEYDYTLPE
jgi:hypothetical protein